MEQVQQVIISLQHSLLGSVLTQLYAVRHTRIKVEFEELQKHKLLQMEILSFILPLNLIMSHLEPHS